MVPALAGRTVGFPEEFRAEAHSYFVWGTDRTAANLLAHALAAFIDPAFLWLSFREFPDRPTPDEAWVTRTLPQERRLAGAEKPAAGEKPPGEVVDRWVVIWPGQATVPLVDFLRTPERFRALVPSPADPAAPRVLVAANTDRVRSSSPSETEAIGALDVQWSSSGVSVIRTAVPPAFAGRFGCDIVLRVDVPSPDDRRYGTLTVEKGLAGGRFQGGQGVPLYALAPYQRTLSAHRGPMP